jgi:hypothetical protein
MTQNTAWSLIGAIVIAVGFLIGWCAGALELVPAPVKTWERLAPVTAQPLSAREFSNDAHAHPVRSEPTAPGSL